MSSFKPLSRELLDEFNKAADAVDLFYKDLKRNNRTANSLNQEELETRQKLHDAQNAAHEALGKELR